MRDWCPFLLVLTFMTFMLGALAASHQMFTVAILWGTAVISLSTAACLGIRAKLRAYFVDDRNRSQ